jgi:hypothetical protein
MNKYKDKSKVRDFRAWRSCRRKVGFPTRAAAERSGQDVYQCRICGRWHRTGSNARLAAALRRRRAF